MGTSKFDIADYLAPLDISLAPLVSLNKGKILLKTLEQLSILLLII
jgi:hypothetical protein